MKIFIHIQTGIATSALNTTAPLQRIEIKRGDLFELFCVFHNGAAPVELPADTSGVFIVKKNQRYFEGPLLLADAWEKQPATGEGYRFRLVANTGPLNTALSDSDTLTAMGEVTWQVGENFRTTQKIPVVVANDIYKENEPPPAPGGDAWPLPGSIALKSDVAEVAAQMAAPRAFLDLVADDGSVWRQTLVVSDEGGNKVVTPTWTLIEPSAENETSAEN